MNFNEKDLDLLHKALFYAIDDRLAFVASHLHMDSIRIIRPTEELINQFERLKGEIELNL